MTARPTGHATPRANAPVVLYGASGYTGRLVAQQLLARGADVVLAGRDAGRLARRRDALIGGGADGGRLTTAAAPLDDPAALRRAAGLGAVLVNCAGPFSLSGDPLVEAAIGAGVHYLDTTGEQDWICRVFDHHDGALRARGVAAVPGMAFSHAPGDLLTHLVARAVAPSNLVTVAYDVAGFRMSRGTMHSALEQLGGSDLAYEDGGWTERGNRGLREWFTFPSGRRRIARYPAGDVITIPRHVDAREVRARVSARSVAPAPLAPVLPYLTPALGVVARSPIARGLDRLIDRLPEGPSEEARGRVRWAVAAEAHGVEGLTSRGVCTGPDIYGFTGHAMAEAAIELTDRALAGALAPAQAVDPASFLERMEACGVAWSVQAPQALAAA